MRGCATGLWTLRSAIERLTADDADLHGSTAGSTPLPIELDAPAHRLSPSTILKDFF